MEWGKRQPVPVQGFEPRTLACKSSRRLLTASNNSNIISPFSHDDKKEFRCREAHSCPSICVWGFPVTDSALRAPGGAESGVNSPDEWFCRKLHAATLEACSTQTCFDGALQELNELE